MSLPAVRVYLTRYPDETVCTWSESGKCQDCTCRYSLLAERSRIDEWSREDVLELIDAMPTTCALELADQGPMLLDEVATYLGMPRAHVEHLETLALKKLSRARDMRRAHWDNR